MSSYKQGRRAVWSILVVTTLSLAMLFGAMEAALAGYLSESAARVFAAISLIGLLWVLYIMLGILIFLARVWMTVVSKHP